MLCLRARRSLGSVEGKIGLKRGGADPFRADFICRRQVRRPLFWSPTLAAQLQVPRALEASARAFTHNCAKACIMRGRPLPLGACHLVAAVKERSGQPSPGNQFAAAEVARHIGAAPLEDFRPQLLGRRASQHVPLPG